MMNGKTSFNWDKDIINQFGQKAIQAFRDGAWDVAEAIVTASINEAPIEEGTLRRSIHPTLGGLPNPDYAFEQAKTSQIKTPKPTSVAAAEEVIYISANTPYARRQHEGVGFKHPKGGKAKFIEDPAKRIGTEANIAKQAKKRLGI